MHAHDEETVVGLVCRRVASRIRKPTSDVKESLDSRCTQVRLRSRSRDHEMFRSTDEETDTMVESGDD